MFSFDKTDIQRVAVSSIGAVVLSAASVFAAAAPAHAEAATTPAAWQAAVQRQIDGIQHAGLGHDDRTQVGSVVLAADFSAEGAFAGARVTRSSGDRRIDADALRVATQTAYPALPASYRGAPQTVTLRLYFAETEADAAKAIARDKAKVRFAGNLAGGGKIAAR